MTPEKQRIAKNTLYLYGRMILLLGVSLYTSRVVLNALGVIDYGIYSVIGGVVAMVGFLNSSLTTSTQRFLNVEMGRGDAKSLNDAFCQAINAHFIIAIFAILVLESVGLWFVINKLVIPDGQLENAIWVFQCSILSFAITIISAPYNAAIIANERMSLFAGLSILDAFLRLGVAFVISSIGNNRLKYYAILLLVVSIIMRLIYSGTCVRIFKECIYRFSFKWKLMKQMLSFSGWMIFGCVSDVLAGQGVNMLINVFFGPIFNAARGIAMQVQGAVSQFSSNFIISVNPQIVKQYSSGAINDSFRLVFQSSKLSFFLMLIIVVPISVRMNEILAIWLTDVPQYAAIFAQLILFEYLIRSSYSPIAQINVASGNVRLYQISIACLFICIFIGSYILFRLGVPVYSTFILSIVIALIGLIVRLIILKIQNGFPMGEYLRKVSCPLMIVLIISGLISVGVDCALPRGFIGTLLSVILCMCLTCLTIWLIGLNRNEKIVISSKIADIYYRKIAKK